MNGLVKYEAACRAVADAASIDEVKQFRDQSEAMRAYAKQAKNKQLEVQAAEIRIRAERRIGELMTAQREGGHMATAGRPSQEIGSKTNPISKAPTLAEVGIDKKLADRARKYAAIPEAEFNGIVGEWRDKVQAENERVTVNLLAAGQRAETQEPLAQGQDDDKATAKLRAEFRAMTAEAQEDDWIALRQEIADLRKRVNRQRDELADKNATIKSLSEGSDMGAKLAAKIREVQAIKLTRDDALQAAKRMEYRLKKAEARVAELENMGVDI